MDNRYIGVFDSGVGGLTSIPHIMNHLPNERFIFFGDTARTPYGSKATKTIRQFTRQIGEFLRSKDVKMMVAACNTISASALDVLREDYPDIPIMGVIQPTVDVITNTAAPTAHIGIIATRATVRSNVYPEMIKAARPDIVNVAQQECPLFVPIIEEGLADSRVMDMTIKHYMDGFVWDNHIDTLILGCTHYPMVLDNIHRLYPTIRRVINSSEEIAIAVEHELAKRDMLAGPNDKVSQFYASDLSKQFKRMIQYILDKQEKDLDIRFKNLEFEELSDPSRNKEDDDE